MECTLDVSSASALALPCLDLSKRDMSELPEMEGCEHLRCLYLEGNHLSQLPPSLFSSCPHLQWLDLRNNLLTHLPPSIQLFRDLKTLLLQGNRLTALPTELGELQQLSGLGLADNPLTFPPPEVVRKGTSGVLSFLRAQHRSRRATEESGDGVEEEMEDREEESTMLPRQPLKQTTLAPNDGPQYHQRSGPGPLVLPKQAHIHPHPPPSSPPHQRQAGRRGRGRRDVVGVKMGAGGRSGGGQARLGERQERVIIHVPPLTSEEKLQANIAIEKQRSKESLEQWREEARLDHLKPPSVELGGPTASDTAPYATDRQHSPMPEAGQDMALASPLSDHGEVARKRVEHYNTALQTQRRQAGLISDASSDLLEAERRLAEALAQRDEMEEKKRAYRLTAFTADPYLL